MLLEQIETALRGWWELSCINCGDLGWIKKEDYTELTREERKECQEIFSAVVRAGLTPPVVKESYIPSGVGKKKRSSGRSKGKKKKKNSGFYDPFFMV